jgi:hypothetical protein
MSRVINLVVIGRVSYRLDVVGSHIPVSEMLAAEQVMSKSQYLNQQLLFFGHGNRMSLELIERTIMKAFCY